MKESIQKLFFIISKVSLGIFSRLFPRNDNVWLFGTSGKNVFWESPKYFFLYVSNEKSDSDVRPVWISKSREMVKELRSNGYEAFYYRSLKGIWLSLRGGYSFYSHNIEDINYGLPVGSRKVDFFHGAPLKRFGWDNSNEIGGNGLLTIAKSLYQVLYYRFDIGISSSSYLENIFESATAVQRGRFESTGFPRNDIFYRGIEGWEIGSDVGAVERMRSSDKRMVMYLPTWRSYNEYSFEDVMELERMNSWAESNDSILVFKLHPSSDIDEEAVKEFDNLWLMQQSVDLQPLLKEADVLISDYSSVHNDFLLLDRPILFYPFDLERYRENRGFVRDYENFTPGPKAFDFDGLLEKLDEVVENDAYGDDRKEIRDKCFDDEDGGSCERVWEMIRKDMS